MNPIKDILNLKTGETFTFDIECRDGRTRKLTAHRPDGSTFIAMHMDTTPRRLISTLHQGQRDAFEKEGVPDKKQLPSYVTAAAFSAMLLSGMESDEAEKLVTEWRKTYIREMLDPKNLLQALAKLYANNEEVGSDMNVIADAMNLSVGAQTRVFVKALQVWHCLNARRVTDNCVYFTPEGADEVTRIRCEMAQAKHALIAREITKPGEELASQIGLILANIHEALAVKGMPDVACEKAVFTLLKQWELRNNPLFCIMGMRKASTIGFSLQVGGESYTFFVRKCESGYTRLTCKQLDMDTRIQWQGQSLLCWERIRREQPNKNRALEQHVLTSIQSILDLLKVPGDETAAVLKKIKDQYDAHGGYDD